MVEEFPAIWKTEDVFQRIGTALQHIAPRRTDGEGSIDEAHVRIGLREVPELDASFRHKVLSNEPEAVGTRENLIHNLLRLGVTAEFRQCLNDPK